MGIRTRSSPHADRAVPAASVSDLTRQHGERRENLLLVLDDRAIAHHHASLPAHDHLLIRDDRFLVGDDALLFLERGSSHVAVGKGEGAGGRYEMHGTGDR